MSGRVHDHGDGVAADRPLSQENGGMDRHGQEEDWMQNGGGEVDGRSSGRGGSGNGNGVSEVLRGAEPNWNCSEAQGPALDLHSTGGTPSGTPTTAPAAAIAAIAIAHSHPRTASSSSATTSSQQQPYHHIPHPLEYLFNTESATLRNRSASTSDLTHFPRSAKDLDHTPMHLHSKGASTGVEVEGSCPSSPSLASPSATRIPVSAHHASASTTRRRLSLTVPRPRSGSPAESPISGRGPWSPVHRSAADSPAPRRSSTLPPPPVDHHFKHNKSDNEDDEDDDLKRTRRNNHSNRSRHHLFPQNSHAWGHSVPPSVSPIPPSPDPNNILPLASVASQSDGHDSTGESSPRTSSSSARYWSGESEDYSEEDDILREKSLASSWWASQYDASRPFLPRSIGATMAFAPRTTRRLFRSVRSIFPPYNKYTSVAHSLPNRRKSRRTSGGTVRERVCGFVRGEPWGVTLIVIAFLFLVVILTGTIKYILDPDKRALPWREYCQPDYPSLFSLQDPHSPTFPADHTHKSLAGSDLVLAPITPSSKQWPWPGITHNPYTTDLAGSALDSIEPTTVFLGIFSVDRLAERRNVIRETYGSHPNSRKPGSEGVRLRFIMGRPQPEHAEAVAAENDKYGDIVILDIDENMNNGKTFHYFKWAAEHATVPDCSHLKDGKAICSGETKPAYIAKADDDAFVVISELERHLRASPRKLTFWGYLVNNWFMAGECYALSHDLASYVATSPVVAAEITGKEDKRMSHWLHAHPQREDITWISEKTWIYDHPRAHTVYSHGFLFPSEVALARQRKQEGWEPPRMNWRWSNSVDSYSTVSRFGEAYKPPAPFSFEEQVEALVEGSELSLLRDAPHPRTDAQQEEQQRYIRYAMDHRPSRRERFLGDDRERGGTVIVHFIKKTEWFHETAAALLD